MLVLWAFENIKHLHGQWSNLHLYISFFLLSFEMGPHKIVLAGLKLQ